MTEADAIKKLSELPADDPEVAHEMADDILIEYLRVSGHADLADAYEAAEKIGFRYA